MISHGEAVLIVFASIVAALMLPALVWDLCAMAGTVVRRWRR